MPKRCKGKPPVLLSPLDVGSYARHYAESPYGHFKAEVYPLFIEILGCLSGPLRILDLGGGPAHLAFEFFKRFPKDPTRFVVLDASAELLRMAETRFRKGKDRIRTVHRSFNQSGWDAGLGKFDAIVSNNALFHVRPEKLDRFFQTCHGRLKKNGLFLNQQSFAFTEGTSPYGNDPFSRFLRKWPQTVLPKRPRMTKKQLEKDAARQRAAVEAHKQAIREATAQGIVILQGQTGYHFLTVEKHLASMQNAGFLCGCIWRKREFGVILGLKGRPRVAPGGK
ncbi:MAG: class I SAM-dependent methyltransferase [Planctomycetota bacterium]|jgi:SAM-dependent methyltransferase